MKKYIYCFMLLVAFFIRPALADCTVAGGTNTAAMPLQIGNITAGADLADGTTLYTQTYNLDYLLGSVRVTCEGPGAYYAYYDYSSTPLPKSNWNSGTYAGSVYESGVPGIGVVVWQGTNGVQSLPSKKEIWWNDSNTASSGITSCDAGNDFCNVSKVFKRWDVTFIKTGPISPGIISGENLPCVKVNFTNGSASDGNTVENICFTGSINVVSGTCKTPDVTVPMGDYDVSSFRGKGTASKWVDASIKLTDCPIFYGYGSKGSWYADSSGINGGGNAKNNIFTLKLTPNTPVIDNNTGIFSLSEDNDSAEGIGIQLAYGDSSSQSLVDFSSSKNYIIDLNSSGISSIPLVARYIQTESPVKAGQANSAVTFLINYN